MNCATHSSSQAVAYCRTCGKPLCAVCSRDVRGTIFCENCLADRLGNVVPPTTYAPPAQAFVPPQANVTPGTMPVGPVVPLNVTRGPNPTVAGILAGFLPIGVGAVYNGQYAKGLAHLVIVVGTIVALSSDLPTFLYVVLGIGLGFFYFYQIIDAVRSAHAIQAGVPAPDPFHLADTFSTGSSVDASKIPTGAIVLIGLGVFFLLHTLGVFEFGIGRLWPLFLIFLGGWVLVRRWGLVGTPTGCQCDHCRAQSLMGPAVLITLGLIFQLGELHVAGLGKTWPILFLVIGGVKIFQSSASTAGHIAPAPPLYPAPITPPPPAAPAEPVITPGSSEVNHG